MLGGKQIQDETLGRREGQKGRKSGVLREGRTNPHFRDGNSKTHHIASSNISDTALYKDRAPSDGIYLPTPSLIIMFSESSEMVLSRSPARV